MFTTSVKGLVSDQEKLSSCAAGRRNAESGLPVQAV